jgi:hypothetical protein
MNESICLNIQKASFISFGAGAVAPTCESGKGMRGERRYLRGAVKILQSSSVRDRSDQPRDRAT